MNDRPFSCVVIGARGVGAIHVREIVRAGITDISVAGRTEASAIRTAQHLSRTLNHRICAQKFENVVRSGSNLVCVCTPTSLHLETCLPLLEAGFHVFVEKPLFWDDGFSQQDVEKTCKHLFMTAEGRLAVNHPTSLLAQSFLDCVGPLPQLDAITFSYRTGGRHKGKDIAVDLLPHALSLLKCLADACGIILGPIKQLEKQLGTDNWSCQFEANKTKCSFKFEQDPTITHSEMAFRVNNHVVQRLHVRNGEDFEVFLKIGDSQYAVPNPMSSSIGNVLMTAQNGCRFSDQEDTVRTITRLMAELLIN